MSSSSITASDSRAPSSELSNKIHEILVSSLVYQATLVETNDRESAIPRVIQSMITALPTDDVACDHANLGGATFSTFSPVHATSSVRTNISERATVSSSPSSSGPSLTLPLTITLPLDVDTPGILGTIYLGSDGTAKMRKGATILEGFETDRWARSRKMDCQTTTQIFKGVPITSLICTTNQRHSRTGANHRHGSEPIPEERVIKQEPGSDSEFGSLSSRKYVKKESDSDSKRKCRRPSSAKGKTKAKATGNSADDEDRGPIKREFTPDSDSESGPDNDSPTNSSKRHCSNVSKASQSSHRLTRHRTMIPSASRSAPQCNPLVREPTVTFSAEKTEPRLLGLGRALRRDMTDIWRAPELDLEPLSSSSYSPLHLRPLRRHMTIWRASELDIEPPKTPVFNPTSDIHRARSRMAPHASTSSPVAPAHAYTPARGVRFAAQVEEHSYRSWRDLLPARAYSASARPLQSAMKTPTASDQPSQAPDSPEPAEGSSDARSSSPLKVLHMPGAYPDPYKRKRNNADEEAPEERPTKKAYTTSTAEHPRYSGTAWDVVDRVFSLLGSPEPASPSHSAVSDDTVTEDPAPTEAGDEYAPLAISTTIGTSLARHDGTPPVIPDNVAGWCLDLVGYDDSPATLDSTVTAEDAVVWSSLAAPAWPESSGTSGTPTTPPGSPFRAPASIFSIV
ncbi:hypothetical protein CVT25_002860 [Psilocybe cyanescens]|uniref:Uncharacterized protein n=1 Tax=Psilocybe cyanescens TaxID=93625 RepID=A0A409WKT6_PSICY|nr:hypothetical protein CVT25_002860 [Psilocybe cyanescens]